jgi:hypothetical protein
MPRQGLLALLLATAACKPAPHDISTVTFARPDVSILTIHGSGDDNVYVAQGERITSALRDRALMSSSSGSMVATGVAMRTVQIVRIALKCPDYGPVAAFPVKGS